MINRSERHTSMKGDKANGRRKERTIRKYMNFVTFIFKKMSFAVVCCRLRSLFISFLAVWDRSVADRCVQLKLQCMKCTFIMETFGGCFLEHDRRTYSSGKNMKPIII